MKKLLGIVWDYIINAIVSAAIGGFVSVCIALVEGGGLLSLGFGASCALVGVVCGTASKLVIEGAFSLFGARRWIAYLLNAGVIAGIVVAYEIAFFGGLGEMDTRTILLAFGLPEAASLLIVRAGVNQAIRLEKAFEKRREELEREELL